MIDQVSITVNSARILERIQQRTPTRYYGLCQIHDILDFKILSRLESYLSEVADSCWQTVSVQANKPRFKISWDADTVVEELHDIFSSTTKLINEIFPENVKYFWGISIWKDLPGYEIGWHTDNPDIDVAVQVYLFGQPGLGTVFKFESDKLLISSMHNSGYLVLNTGDQNLLHCTENVVPDGIIRYSLYAVWSRFPKAGTNT